jgi:PTH1 family peptidyl-tRNA hydrolase
MKLIVGLGNPGEKYKNTRHSAGFLVADELQKIKLPKDVIVKKSDTFMNESGDFVKKMVDQYKADPSDLYIIHDDLDIPLGSYKIQFGKGPKDHNGMKSVDEVLGTNEYWRVRVGIDNRPQENKPMGEVYTLEDFTDEERKVLDNTTKKICKKLATSFKNIN